MRCRAAAGVLAVLMAGTALALGPAGAAVAHPLGNFTVSQYDGIVVSPGRLRVDHVEDLAEIPAAQERPRIDTDRNGRPAEAELSAWARTRCDTAARGARLVVGGEERTTLTAGRARAEERPGQAGLKTLRVTCELTAPLATGEDLRIAYRPADSSTVGGWREITGRGDGTTLHGSDVPQRSVSRRLTAYPDDLLSSPPEHTQTAFTVRSGGPALADGGGADGNGSPVAGVLPRGADRWAEALTGLVARRELTVGFAAFALAAALCLGALHALAPGHGKTMMAAAATAGGRTSLRDVFTLGASVTLTHTLGVFALGALITVGSAAAPTVVSWLTVASGGLVAAAGLLLVRRAWRRRREPPGHGHTHGHGHDRDCERAGGPAHAAGRTDAPAAERVPALAAAGAGHGAAGSPSAAAPVPTDTGHHHDADRGRRQPRHEHDEQEGHQRRRGADAHGHTHPHGHPHHGRPHGHDHDHDHDHTHDHAHAHGHGHSHVPPAPGLRGVVLMGLAGGLVPSPSAVVVLVGAAALGQAWFGFLLVIAYGAGLALTLAAAGFAVVRLRETTMRRLALRPQGRLFSLVGRTAPMASAVVVLTLGCGLLLRGVATALG
ncbi:nickel transporter [Streptomyces sp. NPDC048389]|uniref:nickel transporter n=1 Tax=Streptomyces sp. NPDC048389 TaxID=3154622 RepID=UPI0034524D6E